MVVDTGDEFAITSRRSVEPVVVGPSDRLVLDLEEPMLVRLDAVLAAATGRSRKAARAGMAVVGGSSARLDTLRLWGTVEVDQLRQ